MIDYPKAQQHLISYDEKLAAIISQIELPSIQSTQNVFHDLMSCIVEQQIHYRSTKKTFQKALTASGLSQLDLNNFSEFEKKGLKNIKLSAKKYETIAHIIDFFEQQEVNWEQQDDATVRKLLGSIKGVGVWTIEMILLYTLQRPSIFPADDYHLKQVMAQCYPIDTNARVKAQMKTIAKNWEPHASTAVLYLLEWKKLQKTRTL